MMRASLEVTAVMWSAWTAAAFGRLTGSPMASSGTMALTVIDVVAPAWSVELVVVRKSPTLSDAVSNVLVLICQLRRSAPERTVA